MNSPPSSGSALKQTSLPSKSKPKSKPASNSEPGVNIEDNLLPRVVTQRLAKAALPPGTSLNAETTAALRRAASVFVSYLATSANNQTSRKAIAPSDVLAALAEVEFDEFIPHVRQAIEQFEGGKGGTGNEEKRKRVKRTQGDGSMDKEKAKDEEKESADVDKSRDMDTEMTDQGAVGKTMKEVEVEEEVAEAEAEPENEEDDEDENGLDEDIEETKPEAEETVEDAGAEAEMGTEEADLILDGSELHAHSEADESGSDSE